MRFADPITTEDEMRDVIAPPSELVLAKEIGELDGYCRDFIARSPFVLIASSDGRGTIDISPRGDPPGFVRVLDPSTLAIPDRPGNHRADTFMNVVRHGFVGLIFLVPGSRNTLRVRGRATIVRDGWLRRSMAVKDRVPDLALVVEPSAAYFHCAKCIIRSGLWSTDGPGALASDERLLAETMVEHGRQPMTVEQMQEIILDDESSRLY